jgi:hypothetical protein
MNEKKREMDEYTTDMPILDIFGIDRYLPVLLFSSAPSAQDLLS